ncbi:MAG: hypothetical protein ACLT76_06505 [Clostridium fessum]
MADENEDGLLRVSNAYQFLMNKILCGSHRRSNARPVFAASCVVTKRCEERLAKIYPV